MDIVMKVFVVFASILVLAYCQPPPPAPRCKETPQKWHGHFREVDYDTGFFRFADIDYDADNFQIHIREYEGENDQRPTVKEEWFYFGDQKKWNVSREQPCQSFDFNRGWYPIGIRDARFLGREWIGAEITTLGLEVDEFFDRGENQGGLFHGDFVPIPQTFDAVFIPVLESYVRRDAPFPDRRNIHTIFTNVTTFVSPSAFEHCVLKR